MRTTIRLDEALLRGAKEMAVRTGRTLTAVIEDALRESLARAGAKKPRQAVRLVTFMGQGLQPGIDLDDSAALLDAMEQDHAAS